VKKVYEHAIANWPEDERPREKLFRNGAEQLSNAELLAILLRTGVRGMSAVDLARNILQSLGGLRHLELWDAEDLARIRGLSLAKVAQIKAAIELGKRILQEPKRTLGEVYSAQQVFSYLLPRMRDLKRERFVAIFVNSRKQILKESTVSEGTLTSSSVYPREILGEGYRIGAAAVVFAHNHPSGSVEPSPEDRRITKELVIAGEMMQLNVLDHLIIGENAYFSFAEEGQIDRYRQEIRAFLSRM